MAEFIYNGQSTKDYNLRIYSGLEYELSSHDVETQVVPGRDGVLLLDNKRLEPVERPYSLKLKDNVNDLSTEIAEWLGVKGWHDLTLSWDEGFIYKATVINTISISEVLKQLGKMQVVFLMHPIKYFSDNEEQTISSGSTVTNRGNVTAYPLITLKGNGNTVLTINGRRTVLEDIQGSITLDMKNRLIYSGNLSAWENVVREENSEFPYLNIGKNTISWTGNFDATIVKNEGVRI